MTPGGVTASVNAGDEVVALIEVLHKTEQRLEELTAGQVDTVADSSGRILLLGRSQEKLRQSQAAKQTAILNALPAHVALLDMQGCIVSINDAWMRSAHLADDRQASSPLGANYLDLCDRVSGHGVTSARRAAQGIRAVLAGVAKDFSMEYPCHSPAEKRWFLMCVAPLAADPPNGAVVMHIDVTAERRAEEHLRISESRFRQMAENINEVFFLRDADGNRLLYVSPAYEQIWGRTCESLYDHPESWTESIHPDDRVPTNETIEKGMREGGFTMEYRIVRPDGTIRWILSRGFPVRDESGAVVRIAGIARDITERKQTLAMLEENRQRLALATESAHIGIWDWDVRSGRLIWDSRMYRLYGVAEARAPAVYATWRDSLHPDDRNRAEIEWDSALAAGAEYNSEFRVLWPGGEVRYIEAHAAILRDDGGVAQRMIGVNWDITERKLSEIRLKYLNRIHSMLSGINTLIVRVHTREELFEGACRIAVDEGGFRMSLIGVLDPGTQRVVPVASASMSADELAAITTFLSSAECAPHTLVARAVTLRKALVSNDSIGDPGVLLGGMRAVSGIRSVAIVPLVVRDNVLGILALYAHEKEFFHDEEIRLLTELAGDIAFAIDYVEKQAQLDHLAYYDVLTGLANRKFFLDRVAQYMRSAVERKLALVLIDLERFRSINDSLGRPAGDDLLRQVADWLTYSSGDANLLARVGADHFAMVLPRIGESGDAARLVERTMIAFQEHPFRLDSANFRVSAKVGIALFPDDGVSADVLFKNAEAALKKAKATGDRYLFYDQTMTDAVAGRLALENRLRQAIDSQEFVVHYQPKVNLASGRVTSAEALVRWNDPLTGLVPPSGFISILEENGLILELGLWVLHKAVEDYLRWCDQGLQAVPIAVNVSPLQLRQRDFVREVERAVGHHACAPSGVELEVTESLIMEDVKHTIESLRAVRALGVRVAIDDFGTGFSSLSYLSRLPVDSLKIDRSFIADMTGGPEGLALVSTIINLAHALKLNVVAEGVETEEQARLLRLLGCDEMQGYLVCEALPVAQFEERYLRADSAASSGVRPEGSPGPTP
jgi:diguanylate cyclase (GGDEF)-like protein/PAS domain S-box-containing protein